MVNLPEALRLFFRYLIGITSVFALSASVAMAGEPGDEIILGTGESPTISQMEVPVGNAIVLRFDERVDQVLVGDSDVADVLPLTDRSIYVLGRDIGSTSLTVLDGARQVVSTIHLQVIVDLLPIKMRLHEQYPDEAIEVRSVGRSVMLSGEVSNSAVSATSADIAASYAPDRILNALSIQQPQQVMLAVRVAEVQRSAAQQLGLSVDAFFDAGDSTDGFFADVSDVDASSFLSLGFNQSSFGIDIVLDALEERGVATVLAEPTLMALSGETASFLAGGEFPVPIGRRSLENNSFDVEVDFKEFGVRLGFTPTVNGDTINLVVEPEVSELDRSNGVEVDGFVIPGISSRRATTTVELGHGQSFAIAGLISENFVDEINQVPGLGDLPIFGAIGRSTSYRRQETELVIIVTPYLVTPSTDGSLTDPVASLVRPNTLEMFFLGRAEMDSNRNDNEEDEPQTYASVSQHVRQQSGLDGAVGYVLE